MAKPTDKSMMEIRINTAEKTISFSGLTYTNWAHIRWLRSQLAVMETNAEALWGDEAEWNALQRQKADNDAKFKFSVIDGGKERGESND